MSSSEFSLLEKIELLGKNNIKIDNPSHVEKLLEHVVNGGFSKLQIVSDFDDTITKHGEFRMSSFGILDNSHLMPSFYRTEADRLFKKYYPIEIDPNMTMEEKIPLMQQWYGQIDELLRKCNVSKKSIKQMVADSNVQLRDRTEALFERLEKKEVPTLIFSAGMGDILEHVLWHFDVYSKNVKVVSNFFKYDDEEIMQGFRGDLIHMFNKNENAIHSSDYFEKLIGRTNIILLGDSLGDTSMAHGMPQPNNILKIGFLNDKVEERLPSYLKAYDIVLLNDQTMDVANSIIGLLQ